MHFKSTENSREHISTFPKNYESLILSAEQLKSIEDTSIILAGQKAQLLQIVTGSRMTTELWPITYDFDHENDMYIPNEADVRKIEDFLKNLPFQFTKIFFYREGRNIGKLEKSMMFQVSGSAYTNEYISNYWQTFSAFEQGVLYGYPTSTILAYLGMLERADVPSDKFTPAMKYIGPGFYSKKFFAQEKEYYATVWDSLRKLSPKIVTEVENLQP